MTFSIKRVVGILAASLILVGLVAGAASVLTLRATTRVAATLSEFERHAAAKSDLIADLRRVLGYGGMIHQFKNMVLRRNTRQVEVVHAAAKAAEQALQTYRGIGVNAEEASSLQAIESAIRSYRAATDTVEPMIKDGKTVPEIDQVVKIDDSPALAGSPSLITTCIRCVRRAQPTFMQPWQTLRQPSSAPPSPRYYCSPGSSSPSCFSRASASCDQWPTWAMQ